MSNLIDSGERREFETGAVRDMSVGKGRCDLMPLDVVSDLVDFYFDDGSFDWKVSVILKYINNYIYTGNVESIYFALQTFIENVMDGNLYSVILDVSVHYEDGCEKYGERNWERGIPIHSFVDSGVRHLLKYARGDCDEKHDRAFVWNMFAILWTSKNKKDMIDLPFNK